MLQVKEKKVIQLNLELHPAQAEIDNSTARFKVIEAGRRFGKTIYSLYWLIKHAAVPGTVNWLVAPSYRQAKEIGWRELLHMLPRSVVRSYNNTDLSVVLKNGSICALKGSENKHSLRGVKLHSAVLEEAAYQDQEVWYDIIRPSLADTIGEALFISTPRGSNWFSKIYDYAKSGKDTDWEAFHYTIYDNPTIARGEIDKLRMEVSHNTFEQEFMANPQINVGMVYPEFDENKNVYIDGNEHLDWKSWPCIRSIDWGQEDDTACVWLLASPGGKVVVPIEYSQNNMSVPRHSEIIKMRSSNLKIDSGNNVLDRTAYRTEGTSQSSIAKLFQREGITCVPSERDVFVGIDVVKRFLANEWVAISSACKKLIEGLKIYEYDSHEPDVVAAFRYGLVHLYRKNLCKLAAGMEVIAPSKEAEEAAVLSNGQRFLRRRRVETVRWDWDSGVPSE